MSNNLEQEFRELSETIGKEIKEKLAAAEKLLAEATSLSDKHGIPFSASISELGQDYVPSSFKEKFRGIDQELVEELTEVSTYTQEDGGWGWEHSDIC